MPPTLKVEGASGGKQIVASEIEDDSGSVRITRIEGSVRIREDASGAIVAQNVRGDVIVVDLDGPEHVRGAGAIFALRLGHAR